MRQGKLLITGLLLLVLLGSASGAQALINVCTNGNAGPDFFSSDGTYIDDIWCRTSSSGGFTQSNAVISTSGSFSHQLTGAGYYWVWVNPHGGIVWPDYPGPNCLTIDLSKSSISVGFDSWYSIDPPGLLSVDSFTWSVRYSTDGQVWHNLGSFSGEKWDGAYGGESLGSFTACADLGSWVIPLAWAATDYPYDGYKLLTGGEYCCKFYLEATETIHVTSLDPAPLPSTLLLLGSGLGGLAIVRRRKLARRS